MTSYSLIVGPEVELSGSSRVRWQRAEDDEVLAYVVGEPVTHRNLRGVASHKAATLEVVDE